MRLMGRSFFPCRATHACTAWGFSMRMFCQKKQKNMATQATIRRLYGQMEFSVLPLLELLLTCLQIGQKKLAGQFSWDSGAVSCLCSRTKGSSIYKHINALIIH